jgi:uncharacterized membrane protein YvlD (DUF360 family)
VKSPHSFVRPAAQRPSLGQVVIRVVVVSLSTAFALWLLALVLGDFDIARPQDALLAGLVVGLLNAVVWPLLSFIVVPISVLTLGIGAIAMEAVIVGLILEELPGITIASFWTALVIVIGLAALTAIVSSALAIDDDVWFDQRMATVARRRSKSAAHTDVPGIVFVQLDGVAEVVMRRALRAGDAPTIDRWLREGTHHLVGWETGWSSQTGVSQCGILHGSTANMPAFRWVDKAKGRVIVSNKPESAAEIERAHSDGNGLLAHDGSSYGNLFSGDAERAVLTMSGIAKRKEGRVGAGYVGYFSRPQQAVRTLLATFVELARERRAAQLQRARDVQPRVHRGWTYALLRVFTTVISRDVSVQGVLNDVAEGRAAIYVDLLGYDEVAHHSGPERVDALAVLRDLDRQLARIARSFQWAPRPYLLVVLSDHGQTQGTPFSEASGETLAQLVARLCGGAASGDADAERGKTESSAWLRKARSTDGPAPAEAAAVPTVLGSGSLGLITLPGPDRRLTRNEIDEQYPDLLPGLVEHPHVGFALVASDQGSLVLGHGGSHNLATGEIVGKDPLGPFGPRAVEQVQEVDRFTTVADVMVNARYDAERDEVSAFEAQVGSHGGMGGPQTHPFLLYPVELSAPAAPIFTSVGMHRVLKSWLAEVGQPVVLPWLNGSTDDQLELELVPDRDAVSAGDGDGRLDASRRLDTIADQAAEVEPAALVEAEGGPVVVRRDEPEP